MAKKPLELQSLKWPFVGLAVLHDFGIATSNSHSGRLRGPSHRSYFRFQNFCGQASFENIGDEDSLGAGARHRKIIHGPIDRQFPNRASWKT